MKKDNLTKEHIKKCNVITCIHHAGGYCVSFDINCCEVFERHFMQEG